MRSCPALDLCPGARSAQHHSAGQPDAGDVEPPLAEIEQVRIEQRGHDVATHDDEPEPRNERAVAKQGKVGGPHGDEYGDADEAELERDREDLAVGFVVIKKGFVSAVASRRNSCGMVPVPWPMTGASPINASDFFQYSSRDATEMSTSLAPLLCTCSTASNTRPRR